MTNTSWTARVEWTGTSHNEAEVDEILTKLEDNVAGPVVGLEHDPGEHYTKVYSAHFTLEAGSLRQATSTALQVTERATGRRATGVEVLTTVEFDRRVLEPSIPSLVGYAEIAELAGVSRARARQLAELDGFPPAVVTTAAGPLRVRVQVLAWLARWERKAGRPRKHAAGITGNPGTGTEPGRYEN